jgi:DNA integrity scanning protein DisA with diadenylate cyclase activity
MVDPALLNVRAAQKTAERYLQDASYWLNEYTKHLAALMLPDGTVVTGEWLNPVAIGAKLKVESSDRIRPEFSAFLESAGKGMRHRSVASAITAVPDAFGVVVSSDGPVTIFRGASIPGDAVMEAIM